MIYDGGGRLLFHTLIRMEKRLSDLHTDVEALTGTVATLVDLVGVAITTLQGIVDTSGDDAAVVAANEALTTLVANLQAVETPPAPPAAS